EQPAEDEAEFMTNWRNELMNLTWDALAREESASGQWLHTVLRFRADHPQATMEQIAEQLGPRVGGSATAEWVRKRLHRARKRFTDLLLEEIRRTLANPTEEELTEEVIALGLLDYCKSALERRRSGGGRE